MYGLTGKLTKDGEIIGYFIIDEYEKEMLISKEKTIKLAEKLLLKDIDVVTDEDGEKFLYSSSINLSDIPRKIKADFEELKVRKNIESDGKIIGFECIDNNGKIFNVKADKLWELASCDKVKDVKAKVTGQNKVIIHENSV